MDLENVDGRQLALLAGLIATGVLAIVFSRTSERFGIDTTTAVYVSIVIAALAWTGILAVLIRSKGPL